jgi:hypothetical protein
MTREFQPGDTVSLPRHIRTVKTVEQHNFVGLRLLSFEDGGCGIIDNFELVEPVVTHRELRAACLKVYAGQHEFGPDFVLGERSALLQLFFNLTGDDLF